MAKAALKRHTMRPVGEEPGACDAPAGVRSAHATMHTAGPANATPCRHPLGSGFWVLTWAYLCDVMCKVLQRLCTIAHKRLRAYLGKLANICDSPALGD